MSLWLNHDVSVLLHLGSFCDARSLARLASTCRTWHTLITSHPYFDALWRVHLCTRWPGLVRRRSSSSSTGSTSSTTQPPLNSPKNTTPLKNKTSSTTSESSLTPQSLSSLLNSTLPSGFPASNRRGSAQLLFTLYQRIASLTPLGPLHLSVLHLHSREKVHDQVWRFLPSINVPQLVFSSTKSTLALFNSSSTHSIIARVRVRDPRLFTVQPYHVFLNPGAHARVTITLAQGGHVPRRWKRNSFVLDYVKDLQPMDLSQRGTRPEQVARQTWRDVEQGLAQGSLDQRHVPRHVELQVADGEDVQQRLQGSGWLARRVAVLEEPLRGALELLDAVLLKAGVPEDEHRREVESLFKSVQRVTCRHVLDTRRDYFQRVAESFRLRAGDGEEDEAGRLQPPACELLQKVFGQDQHADVAVRIALLLDTESLMCMLQVNNRFASHVSKSRAVMYHWKRRFDQAFGSGLALPRSVLEVFDWTGAYRRFQRMASQGSFEVLHTHVSQLHVPIHSHPHHPGIRPEASRGRVVWIASQLGGFGRPNVVTLPLSLSFDSDVVPAAVRRVAGGGVREAHVEELWEYKRKQRKKRVGAAEQAALEKLATPVRSLRRPYSKASPEMRGALAQAEKKVRSKANRGSASTSITLESLQGAMSSEAEALRRAMQELASQAGAPPMLALPGSFSRFPALKLHVLCFNGHPELCRVYRVQCSTPHLFIVRSGGQGLLLPGAHSRVTIVLRATVERQISRQELASAKFTVSSALVPLDAISGELKQSTRLRSRSEVWSALAPFRVHDVESTVMSVRIQ